MVEAAHFNPEGELLWVRAYERRGPTWSDVVLLDREHLLKRLEKGKRFFVGQRQKFKASEFKLGKAINLGKGKSGPVIIVGHEKNSEKDVLESIPRL